MAESSRHPSFPGPEKSAELIAAQSRTVANDNDPGHNGHAPANDNKPGRRGIPAADKPVEIPAHARNAGAGIPDPDPPAAALAARAPCERQSTAVSRERQRPGLSSAPPTYACRSRTTSSDRRHTARMPSRFLSRKCISTTAATTAPTCAGLRNSPRRGCIHAGGAESIGMLFVTWYANTATSASRTMCRTTR